MYDRDSGSEDLVASLFNERGRHRLVAFAMTVCMILSALTVLSVASPAVDAVADDYVQIKVGTVLEPDDFNPFSMTTGISYMVAWMMYEMLYTIGPELEEYPQLAESYETSADGKIWTYFLAEDSYWHDGEKVTAHDVAFTFNMIMDNPKPCALLSDYLSGFLDVTATDDYTVQITLEKPKATMLSITVPILPEHLWADVEEAKEIKTVDMFDSPHFPDGPVGSGPMILAEYSKADGFIRLKAQDPYHRLDGIEVDSINVDEILFAIYANEGAMTTALETGEIDIVDGVPELLWKTALGYDNVEGQAPVALDLTEAGFNCAPQAIRESLNEDTGEPNFPDASTNYETCNLSVRQAITMATDRALIVETILQSLAEEADSLIPTATPFWHYNVTEEEKFHFDIAAANDLLNNSGYHRFDGSDFGFAGVRENESSGARLEFDFYYIRSTTRDQLTAGKMEIWCRDIGVKLNLIDVSEGTLYDLWFNLEYDMFIWNWQPDVDPTFLLSVLTTDQIPDDYKDSTAWSDAFYTNPVYDQLFEDQKNAMDKAERQAIVHEMQRIAYRDCPYICLWYPSSLIAYRTDVLMNIPDMERYIGMTPDSIWFYFEVVPYDEGANDPPYDVDAGEDGEVYVGDDKTFSGSAEDLDNSQEELNWTWRITEEDVETTLYGQTITHTFNTVCVAEVTLTVSDPEGTSSSDSITITVMELPEGGVGEITGYVKDSAGEPIEGALVGIVGSALNEDTDALGFYSMSVAPGTYDIDASADGYANATAGVTIEAEIVSWLNFTLGSTSGSVAGHVYDSATETPVANALVQLFQPGDENASYSKQTDGNGSFTIAVVEVGNYTVVVSKDGYETNDTTNLEVTLGATVDLDIRLTAIDDDGGSNTMAIAAAAAIVIIAALAATVLLLKRRKGSGAPDDEPSSEQAEEPGTPPPG